MRKSLYIWKEPGLYDNLLLTLIQEIIREHSRSVVRSQTCEREAQGSIPCLSHCFVYLGNTRYPACLGMTWAVKMSTSTVGELTCDRLASCPGGVISSHPLHAIETGVKHRPQGPKIGLNFNRKLLERPHLDLVPDMLREYVF